MTMKVVTVFQILTNFLLFVGSQGKLITCVCTTDECHAQNNSRCNTTHMCYSQYLDRGDGSNPLTQGCINSKTPLLCENRRPAVSDGNWPILKCCNTNMCNEDPVIPQLVKANEKSLTSLSGSKTKDSANRSTSSAPRDGTASNKNSLGTTKGIAASNGSAIDPPSLPGYAINPAYAGALAAGGMMLTCLGALAWLLLRPGSSQRLCDTEYATIERNGYFKAHQSRSSSREDPELQMPRTTNGIYNNKITVNT